jgi:hypothetical protein
MSIKEFEASSEVGRLLIKLESLTDEIIQLDRSRNCRRRGIVPAVWFTLSNCFLRALKLMKTTSLTLVMMQPSQALRVSKMVGEK